jgi:hypothetical protein
MSVLTSSSTDVGVVGGRFEGRMNLQPKNAARQLDGQWSQVRDMLRSEFGETAFNTWLAPLARARN